MVFLIVLHNETTDDTFADITRFVYNISSDCTSSSFLTIITPKLYQKHQFYECHPQIDCPINHFNLNDTFLPSNDNRLIIDIFNSIMR